ncbi:hypothetical protein NG791_16810 [Laspinema sp. D1]|uniref:hypothetical protein n=1 Tax=Laspinema palackyanum TaxID=3231601 RepID=UPI0034866757|nr:hypothetical protein [Laspinema sp. D2b]
MNTTEIGNLPPSMQRTYAELKKRLRFPDERLYLAPVSAGHIFADTRNDAMKAFVVQGAGLSLAEEEPDGIPKPYHAFLLKEGFPGIKDGEATVTQPAIAPTPAAPVATPTPPATPVATPVDNA